MLGLQLNRKWSQEAPRNRVAAYFREYFNVEFFPGKNAHSLKMCSAIDSTFARSSFLDVLFYNHARLNQTRAENFDDPSQNKGANFFHKKIMIISTEGTEKSLYRWNAFSP